MCKRKCKKTIFHRYVLGLKHYKFLKCLLCLDSVFTTTRISSLFSDNLSELNCNLKVVLVDQNVSLAWSVFGWESWSGMWEIKLINK